MHLIASAFIATAFLCCVRTKQGSTSSYQSLRRAKAGPMLALRLIGPSDHSVHDDGQRIGRIRLARDRTPPLWLWNVTVMIPGPPFGDAKSIDEAKARFKSAWLAFKEKHGAAKLAKAYKEMNIANRPDRYQR